MSNMPILREVLHKAKKVFQFNGGKVIRIEEAGITNYIVKSKSKSLTPALMGWITKNVPLTRH